ncbi:hypothetical protein KC726_04440 [Candidatus Woesebacteria bacterium]|nr:hypothetical protein [Candidatus Woesebacteria bacterium]
MDKNKFVFIGLLLIIVITTILVVKLIFSSLNRDSRIAIPQSITENLTIQKKEIKIVNKNPMIKVAFHGKDLKRYFESLNLWGSSILVFDPKNNINVDMKPENIDIVFTDSPAGSTAKDSDGNILSGIDLRKKDDQTIEIILYFSEFSIHKSTFNNYLQVEFFRALEAALPKQKDKIIVEYQNAKLNNKSYFNVEKL